MAELPKGSYFLNTSTNPYENLDRIMLGQSPTENVQNIVKSTRKTLEEEVFPKLIVIPDRPQTKNELIAAMRQGHLDFAFVVNEGGSSIGAMVLDSKNGLSVFPFSFFSPAFAASMDEKRILAQPLRQQHLAGQQALIGNVSGGTMIEIGACDDAERIHTLQKLATESHADFLCQDLTPAAADHGSKRRPSIPYLAIPPGPYVMGGSLKVARHPHVWTMQNVLSSLGFFPDATSSKRHMLPTSIASLPPIPWLCQRIPPSFRLDGHRIFSQKTAPTCEQQCT